MSSSDKPAPRRSTFLALVAAFLVALVVIAYLYVDREQVAKDAAADQDRLAALTQEKAAGQEALAAARSLLVDITSYSHRGVGDDFAWLDRISDDALRTRMDRNVKALIRIIRSTEARAEGKVIDAAARPLDDTHVEVIAFVDQVIRDGRHQGYKLEEQRVSMTMVLESGEWMIDRLDLQSGNNAG